MKRDSDPQYTDFLKRSAYSANYLLSLIADNFEAAQATGGKQDIVGAVRAYVPMMLLQFLDDTAPEMHLWAKVQMKRVRDLAKGMEENPSVDAFVNEGLKGQPFAPRKK